MNDFNVEMQEFYVSTLIAAFCIYFFTNLKTKIPVASVFALLPV